jgi:hypothetical protein
VTVTTKLRVDRPDPLQSRWSVSGEARRQGLPRMKQIEYVCPLVGGPTTDDRLPDKVRRRTTYRIRKARAREQAA